MRFLALLTLTLPLALAACSDNPPPRAPYSVEEVPLSQVSDDLAAGRLVKPFTLSFPANAAYWLVAPSEAWDRPKIKSFREWLLAEAE